MEFKEPKKYSRRQILTAPFDHFKDDGVNSTDTLLEYGGEALSVMGMLYLAWKGSQDQLVSYEVKSESRLKNLSEFPEIMDFFERFASVINPMYFQLKNLKSAWTSAYEDYECRTVPVITYDSKGNSTITTKTECEYVWKDATLTRLGLGHNQIYNWENDTGDLIGKLESNQKQAPEAFDLSNNGSSLYYSEKAVDTTSQFWMAGLAFGIVGGAFCTYEEALHHMTDDGYGYAFIDDKKYIKRRTFLKLAAAGLLSFKIRDLQRAFASENKDLLKEIKGNTAQVVSQTDASPDVNFKRVMGNDVQSVRSKLLEIKDRTQVLLSGYNGFLDSRWNKVRSSVENTNVQADTTLKLFDDFFQYESGNYQIPPAMDLANRNLYGTREITKFAGSKSTTIYTRHLTDALLMALGLGTIAVIGEKAVFPLSDKLQEPKS
ncbi:MAG: hypothetical protein WCV81_04200 [Microgenomates group bacterium]|jgi:hypothetical protein